MLNRLGCFHFGDEDKSRPFASFQKALDNALSEQGAEYIRNSLIVLPEAFNLIGHYAPRFGDYGFEFDTASRLRDLASEYDAAFVVGLVDQTQNRSGFRYSSAYLITDEKTPSLLSRKIGQDDMAKGVNGDKLYEPSPESHDAPTVVRDTGIAALVCMDAAQFPTQRTDNRDRHTSLRAECARLNCQDVILCVPANTRYFGTTAIAQDWPDFHFVLANGCGNSQYSSVIRIRGREPKTFERSASVVHVEVIVTG